MVTYRKPPAHHEATKDTMSPRCRLRTRKEITLPIHGCRGARRPRREERAYRTYVSDEQRRPPGWIGSQNGNVISFRVLKPRRDVDDAAPWEDFDGAVRSPAPHGGFASCCWSARSRSPSSSRPD